MPDLLSSLALEPVDPKTVAGGSSPTVDDSEDAQSVFGALLAAVGAPGAAMAPNAGQGEGGQPVDGAGGASAEGTAAAATDDEGADPLAGLLRLGATKTTGGESGPTAVENAPVPDRPGGRPVVEALDPDLAASSPLDRGGHVTVLPRSRALLSVAAAAPATGKEEGSTHLGASPANGAPNPGRPIFGGRPVVAAGPPVAPGKPDAHQSVVTRTPASSISETTVAAHEETGAPRPAGPSADPAMPEVKTMPEQPAIAQPEAGSAQRNVGETVAPTPPHDPSGGASLEASTPATSTAAPMGTGGLDAESLALATNVRTGAASSTTFAESAGLDPTATPDRIRAQAMRFVLDRGGPLRGDQTVTLQLDPEHLGKVEVKLVARGQRLEVVFQAETAEAQQALRDGAAELARNLGERMETRWHAIDVRVNEPGSSGRASADPEAEEQDDQTDEQRDRSQDQQQRQQRRKQG
jgi:hypothetical protein